WVEESGGKLLGSSLDAVKLTSDKLALGRHLQRHGVATPESDRFVPGQAIPHARFPMVWKPRFGAGSQATFLVNDPQELHACAHRARAEGWEGEALVQPFVPGQPASVAFLIGPHSCVSLLPAT